MINLQDVDPFALPSVPLEDRKKLYKSSGVYFVVQDGKDILYIGQSPLIKSRWNQHHLLRKLTDLEKKESRIHWFAIDQNWKEVEAVLIHKFHPKFNRWYPPLDSTTEEPREKRPIQVRRVVEIVLGFSGVGDRIRQAREDARRQGRTLTAICKECDLSRSYWYQLESEDLRSPVTEGVIRRIEAVLKVDLGVKFDD